MELNNLTEFFECPICGTAMENVYRDEDGSLVLKHDDGVEDVFLCDDGVFRFIQDEEHPELLHVDWHHQH